MILKQFNLKLKEAMEKHGIVDSIDESTKICFLRAENGKPIQAVKRTIAFLSLSKALKEPIPGLAPVEERMSGWMTTGDRDKAGRPVVVLDLSLICQGNTEGNQGQVSYRLPLNIDDFLSHEQFILSTLVVPQGFVARVTIHPRPGLSFRDCLCPSISKG